MDEDLLNTIIMRVLFISGLFFLGSGFLIFLDIKASGGISGAFAANITSLSPGGLNDTLQTTPILEWIIFIVSFLIFVFSFRAMRGCP